MSTIDVQKLGSAVMYTYRMLIKRERMSLSTRKANRVARRDFTYMYDRQTIAYSVWAVGDTVSVKTIIFLGTVQVGKLPAWIAENCPDGTAVVQGAPHWLARDDGSDIHEFMYRFTEEVFASVLRSFHCDSLNIIAESQAAPCVLEVLAANDEYSSKISAMVLIQPLGLNVGLFGTTAEQRSNTFKQRTAENLWHQLPTLLHDSRLRHNHRQILRIVGYDNPKSNAQYGSGLDCDVSEDLQKLHVQSVPMAIICGGKDMLFPPHEIQATLDNKQLDIPLIVIPGVPHSPLAATQGLKLLHEAVGQLHALHSR